MANLGVAPGHDDRAKLKDLAPLIERHAAELTQPGVLSIRPGYRLENDWPTMQPAIVVVKSPSAGDIPLPSSIEGVPVDVRVADPAEQLRHDDPVRYAKLAARHPELRDGALPEVGPDVADEGAAAPAVAAAKPHMPYAPASVPLAPVTGRLTFTCHASPDAGWPTLKNFLAATRSSLTIGLYDWTAAHILDQVKQTLAVGQKLDLVLDHPSTNPTADQTDPETIKALDQELGDAFAAAWALVRGNKDVARWIYPTAYHIKVAVRDGNSFWLSSGNWNNSNQPDFDPIHNPRPDDQKLAKKSDRDWHVIVENADLAATYEAYLKHDLEVAEKVAPAAGPGVKAATPAPAMPPEFRPQARGQAFQFFEPLRLENEPATITPLLTPDPGNYRNAMLELIQSAQRSLYIQLQYIHPSDDEEDDDYMALLNAVVAKISAGIDVRIIVGQFQSLNGWLERLQDAGVDLAAVKIQNGVHNKGFIVDSKRVALGSQNWSGDGVLRNRDASVIIDNPKAAAYYEQIFLHDWNRIAQKSVR